ITRESRTARSRVIRCRKWRSRRTPTSETHRPQPGGNVTSRATLDIERTREPVATTGPDAPGEPPPASRSAMRPHQWAGLLIGAAAFLTILLLPAPTGLSLQGWRMAAVCVLMAVWWMTEAIPISATALV